MWLSFLTVFHPFLNIVPSLFTLQPLPLLSEIHSSVLPLIRWPTAWPGCSSNTRLHFQAENPSWSLETPISPVSLDTITPTSSLTATLKRMLHFLKVSKKSLPNPNAKIVFAFGFTAKTQDKQQLNSYTMSTEELKSLIIFTFTPTINSSNSPTHLMGNQEQLANAVIHSHKQWSPATPPTINRYPPNISRTQKS